MKNLLLALSVMLSSEAFARQYIQCSYLGDSTDVAVVNLQTENEGTLFLSSGMQNPEDERILFDIAFDKIENNNHVFKLVNGSTEGQVTVPSSMIGQSANSLEVNVTLIGYGMMEYSCFSRIYND